MSEIPNDPQINKNFKKYQRDELFPLYLEHANYLLNAIKTAEIEQLILDDIEEYITDATCHEIAINNLSNLNLETHENRLGKEREIENHPYSKKIGRDTTVRTIWRIIEAELRNDISLNKFETIDSDGPPKIFEVHCPYCETLVYEVKRERINDGYHMDGTADFHYEYDYGGQRFGECEHLIIYDDDFNKSIINSDVESIMREIHRIDRWYDTETFIEEFGRYERLSDHDIIRGNQNLSHWYFVEDTPDFLRFLKNKLHELEKEEEEKEEKEESNVFKQCKKEIK